MKNNNDIRHGRHCVFKMHVHLVFVAKYRRRVFDGDAVERLRSIFGKVCFGRHPISPHRAAVLRLALFASTLSSSRRRIKVKGMDGVAVRAILPGSNSSASPSSLSDF